MHFALFLGIDITVDIENGLRTWDDLFARSEFFLKNKHFIRVDAIATNEADHHLWYEFKYLYVYIYVRLYTEVYMI